jgi:hypothetical protein
MVARCSTPPGFVHYFFERRTLRSNLYGYDAMPQHPEQNPDIALSSEKRDQGLNQTSLGLPEDLSEQDRGKEVLHRG